MSTNLDLFKDWLPSIMQTKKSVIRDELDIRSYVPYMVNRALSLHMDCIFHAQKMNMCFDLPKLAQYQYHMAAIVGRRRPFAPWPKRLKTDDLELIKTHFGLSTSKAEETLAVLSTAQLQHLREMYRDAQS